MEDKLKKQQKHLGDVLNTIDFILVYNDINDAHFFNFLSAPLDEDVDDVTDSEDAARLVMTDAQLKTIPDDEVHKITNIELLDRICKVDKTKLSDAQQKTLIALYKQKFIVDEKDVEKILECIKKCDKLFTEKRPVNMTFMNTYGLNDTDVLKILQGMTAADYYCNTRSININHLGNNLLIFEPVVNLGDKQQKICVYIKLDIDETTKDCVMLVSIHAGDRQPTPYGEKQPLNAEWGCRGGNCMRLNEKLSMEEQGFLSDLIDELEVDGFIDWDKSEYSICLFPEKLDEFNEKYREEIPEKYFNVLSRCLHPETWEKLSGLRARFWGYATGELTIPEGVRAIPPNAFLDCFELTSIKIPSSVTSIGDYAFYNCSELVIETKDSRIADICEKMGVKVKLIESLQLTETRRQTAVKSNGVYSVLRDEWIKEPVAEDIPEINEEEFEKLFKEWEDKYFALLDEVK